LAVVLAVVVPPPLHPKAINGNNREAARHAARILPFISSFHEYYGSRVGLFWYSMSKIDLQLPQEWVGQQPTHS
jgi:hypothetical protein